MPPQTGGWPASGRLATRSRDHGAETPEEIDRLVPLPSTPGFLDSDSNDGKQDLGAALLREYGDVLYPVRMVSAPLWGCYELWGFEAMMVKIATRPDLVEHACRRFLALGLHQVRLSAALGAVGIWIEDCLTDLIHPDAFAALNAPFLSRLVEQIHALGLGAIHYFCGNPAGKWDQIIGIGADALALEESKKGFLIDIPGRIMNPASPRSR